MTKSLRIESVLGVRWQSTCAGHDSEQASQRRHGTLLGSEVVRRRILASGTRFSGNALLITLVIMSLSSCSFFSKAEKSSRWAPEPGYVEVERIELDSSINVLWVDPTSKRKCWEVESRSATSDHLGAVGACQINDSPAVSLILGSLVGIAPQNSAQRVILKREDGQELARATLHSGIFIAHIPSVIQGQLLTISTFDNTGMNRVEAKVAIS